LKALLRDRDTFVQFVKAIFEKHPNIIEEVVLADSPDNYGLYDITQLQEFYMHCQTEIEKANILKVDELHQELQQ